MKYKNVIFKPWQGKILGLLSVKPDDRKIIWVCDRKGNIGKSFLCKYICLQHKVIMCSGKTNDIFNQVNMWNINNPDDVQIPTCIVDIPRSEFAHVNYPALEQLKNGFAYSGKYEGGQIFGLSPHVIIFSNSLPDLEELSKDRWLIIDLDAPVIL